MQPGADGARKKAETSSADSSCRIKITTHFFFRDPRDKTTKDIAKLDLNLPSQNLAKALSETPRPANGSSLDVAERLLPISG
jgi:hypothetical protein